MHCAKDLDEASLMLSTLVEKNSPKLDGDTAAFHSRRFPLGKAYNVHWGHWPSRTLVKIRKPDLSDCSERSASRSLRKRGSVKTLQEESFCCLCWINAPTPPKCQKPG